MLILALDTMSLTASAALWRDEVIVAQYFLNSGHTHSTTLLPMIKHMMETSGVSLDDVDLLACAVGPGSFTGIRIGIATLKGLCVGKNISCVGVSSLEAMAYGMRGVDGIVCPVINARRTQFYSSLFRVKNGLVSRLSEDDIVMGADLDSVLSPYDEAVYLVGDGYGAAREFITHKHLKYTPELYRWPTAFAVADAAAKIWNDASDKSVFTQDSISPVYLRKTQAEREREERISAAQNGDI
jgi:tRNA threonylcarbamoyladenosine biosynthesis protein TsaB